MYPACCPQMVGIVLSIGLPSSTMTAGADFDLFDDALRNAGVVLGSMMLAKTTTKQKYNQTICCPSIIPSKT